MDKWEIDAEYADQVKSSILKNERALKKWPKFVTAVTANPFYHSKSKRIEKMFATTYPPGSWRYKDEPLRVVYFPDKETRTIYPLEAGTTLDMAYKKRSKR